MTKTMSNDGGRRRRQQRPRQRDDGGTAVAAALSSCECECCLGHGGTIGYGGVGRALRCVANRWPDELRRVWGGPLFCARPIFDFVQDAKPSLTLLQPSYFCHKKILGVGFRFEQNHSLSTPTLCLCVCPSNIRYVAVCLSVKHLVASD